MATIRRLVEVEVLEFDDGEGIIHALDLAEAGADFADALIDSTFRQFGVTRALTFDESAANRLGWELIESADS